MHKTLSGVFECRRAACGKPATPIARTILKKRQRRAKPGDNPEYRAWLVKNCKCVVCANPELQRKWGMEWLTYIDPDFRTIAPCHTVNGGRSLKGPDASCIPLCNFHHAEMDGRLSTKITTKKAFAKKYGLDLANEAASHFAAFILVGKE